MRTPGEEFGALYVISSFFFGLPLHGLFACVCRCPDWLALLLTVVCVPIPTVLIFLAVGIVGSVFCGGE